MVEKGVPFSANFNCSLCFCCSGACSFVCLQTEIHVTSKLLWCLICLIQCVFFLLCSVKFAFEAQVSSTSAYLPPLISLWWNHVFFSDCSDGMSHAMVVFAGNRLFSPCCQDLSSWWMYSTQAFPNQLQLSRKYGSMSYDWYIFSIISLSLVYIGCN